MGIYGVGMSALAHILLDKGYIIGGCDVSSQFDTAHTLPVRVDIGFDHMPTATTVIYTGAHGGKTNPLVERAQERGIPIVPLAQMLGDLSKEKRTIAVAGCHGKTTTTAMLAYALEKSGLEPSWYVGASSFSGYPGGHWGNGDLFIIEADEYAIDPFSDHRPKFSLLHPSLSIITSLDYDHPDIYKSPEEITQQFKMLAQRSPVVTHEHIAQTLSCTAHIPRMVGNTALLGEHNRQNAALVYETLSIIKCQQATQYVATFRGANRRLQQIYTSEKTIIFDDYAHHPTEISATLKALREKYPRWRILALFQPHTYSRSRYFGHNFGDALSEADYAIIMPTFSSQREKKDAEIDLKGANGNVIQSNNYREWLRGHFNTAGKNIIITLGAGDIQKIHKELEHYAT